MAVFLKATQGTGYLDPTFKDRSAQARDAGLMVAAFHFLEADSSGIDQAHWFLEHTHGVVPVLAADWELDNGVLPSVELLSAFLRELLGTGKSVGLYAGFSNFEDHFEEFDAVCQLAFLWLAKYGPAPTIPIGKWTTWTFWQWTDGKSNNPIAVDGYGFVDRDKFNGDEDGLRRIWHP